MTEIFVPGIGQFDNIGDIILRRQLIGWLRPLGRLHIYVGASPPGYDEAIGAAQVDTVYRSFGQFYAAALRSAARGEAAYVAKPGEIQLTLAGMKEHVAVVPLLAMLRRRGGVAVRVGSGARNFAALPRQIMRPSIALSDFVMWRDPATAGYLGGGVMPDLAFAETSGSAQRAGRDTVAVSLRADVRMPPVEWIDGVARYASENNLRIVVVTQVVRDRERSRSLSYALGAELLDWDGTDHLAQERALRAVYRRSRLVLSDRLHVLIAAITEGAAPLAPLPRYSDKIARHFAAAGIDRVAVDVRGFSTKGIVTVLADAVQRGPAPLEGALADLESVRGRVAALLDPIGQVNQMAQAPG